MECQQGLLTDSEYCKLGKIWMILNIVNRKITPLALSFSRIHQYTESEIHGDILVLLGSYNIVTSEDIVTIKKADQLFRFIDQGDLNKLDSITLVMINELQEIKKKGVKSAFGLNANSRLI